tara:strand:- start:71 stop:430 length:360 start_codon:yes stop_codon:yes gene_type:complete
MSFIEITIPDKPDTTQTVILDAVAYELRMQWNGRDEAWYIYLGLSGQPLSFKDKVVNGTILFDRFKYSPACPLGNLYVYDSIKQEGRLQRDSFSSGRFKLYYLEEDFLKFLRDNPSLLE